PEPEESLPPPHLQIEAVQVYVLLAALGGVWLFTRWNRGRIVTDDEVDDDEETPTDDLADRLGAMVNRAGDELSRAGQPRRRVMAAYAEIERALADQQLPRRPSETPSEHVRRVLSALPIDPGPLVDLGHLYELARFSDHPITAEHQGQALIDLDRTRRELAGLPNATFGTNRSTASRDGGS
ncbi:MAG: DUF4129 domain-containing protein, partial [Acidimicrobiia bacterium]|nr:DUF4129 domain-containing protein [Acidimicrobiia bacterium]